MVSQWVSMSTHRTDVGSSAVPGVSVLYHSLMPVAGL